MIPMGPVEVRQLRDTIERHWTALAIRTFGPTAVGSSQDEIMQLVREGILDPSAISMIDPVQDAYLLGFFRRRFVEAGVDPSQISWQILHEYIEYRPLPLTEMERGAIEAARQWAAQYCVGLGNRIEEEVIGIVGAEDQALRARMASTIEDTTMEAIEQHQTVQELAAELASRTGDWTRDWHRIAATELQRAQEFGAARDIEKEFGATARVSKIPNPDACEECIEAYIGSDGKPKVFTLDELIRNGTNRGRRKAAWLPTLDPLHPWCHCRLVYVPQGFHFGDDYVLEPDRTMP
jgi:hypothetical protein